jgi:hypothetical protein
MAASSWRASSRPGGNPGAVDSTVFAGNATADVDKDGFNALYEYATGTSDTNALSHPNFEFSRDGTGALTVSFLHPEAADDVTFEALETTNFSTWTNANAVGDTAASPGWMRSTWRSTATGTQVFLKVRVRLE